MSGKSHGNDPKHMIHGLSPPFFHCLIYSVKIPDILNFVSIAGVTTICSVSNCLVTRFIPVIVILLRDGIIILKLTSIVADIRTQFSIPLIVVYAVLVPFGLILIYTGRSSMHIMDVRNSLPTFWGDVNAKKFLMRTSEMSEVTLVDISMNLIFATLLCIVSALYLSRLYDTTLKSDVREIKNKKLGPSLAWSFLKILRDISVCIFISL